MNIGGFFGSLGHKIAAFFGSHHAAIQAVISDAQTAASAAAGIAAALGEPASVTKVIGQVADGLSKVSAAVTAETTATDLSSHAENLANLATGLVSSGDIGIKNDETKTAVGAVAIKVQSVVGALEIAAATKPV